MALPDRFIIGTSYGEIKLWDGLLVMEADDDDAHHDLVRGLAVLPDGRFVSSSNDNTAKLWKSDGKLERTFEEDGLVGSIAALPDGVHFVVGLWSGELKLDHIDGTLVHVFDHAISLVPDDDVGTVFRERGRRDARRPAHHQRLVHCSSSRGASPPSASSASATHIKADLGGGGMPDGQRFLSGSNDYTVRVWLIDGTLENTSSELHDSTVMALVALPDNQHALSGGSTLFDYYVQDHAITKNRIQLFNVNTGAVLRTFMHHTRSVNSLALMPDGLRFISGSDDETACIVYHGLAPQ